MEDSLYLTLKKADIFFGAAGSSLYEAMSLKKPCVTFTIASNQAQNIDHFKEIGHLFHYNNSYENISFKLLKSLNYVIENYELCQKNLAPFYNYYDCQGVDRISRLISDIRN